MLIDCQNAGQHFRLIYPQKSATLSLIPLVSHFTGHTCTPNTGCYGERFTLTKAEETRPPHSPVQLSQ